MAGVLLLQAVLHADRLAAALAFETIGGTEFLLTAGHRALFFFFGLWDLRAGRCKVSIPRHIRVLVWVETDGLLADGAQNNLHRAMGSVRAAMRGVREMLLAIIFLARVALEG